MFYRASHPLLLDSKVAHVSLDVFLFFFALSGYTSGFWILLGGGVLLFLLAPLINKLMHGVR
ncbi:hypothetical protein B1992_15375 [Pseudoxanthomonas broegbernensis]|uniref:Uncharacterized protein n=1 Tax=Pseudoxanthomonas broegbernensis TaxID=83619 RepID=A0A7V8GJQ4_9GAMM|nr:hypothetical protein B1992_15375 [Pseudoxanthomonas broegbernensis]